MKHWFVLAQAGDILGSPLTLIVLLLVLFWLLVLRPQRRQQLQHKTMLDSLKKNDRVVTIGGIKGTIVNIRREADEVTLKVDDNAKLRVTVGSIARVESEEPSGEKAAS